MHKVKVRLRKEYIDATGQNKLSVGGRYHTAEYQTYTVSNGRMKIIESSDALEIKMISGQSDAPIITDTVKVKKPKTAEVK